MKGWKPLKKLNQLWIVKELNLIKKVIHIYKDGEEIPGSPFNSYREGGKAIGLDSDTGKVFKDVYTFYSSPINKS